VAKRTSGQSNSPSPSPIRAGGTVSSRAFWELVDRLQIPDANALEVIGYPGKIGTTGKRPRFRLSTRQTKLALHLPGLRRRCRRSASHHHGCGGETGRHHSLAVRRSSGWPNRVRWAGRAAAISEPGCATEIAAPMILWLGWKV
jgi:hypothetical protein